MYNVVTRWTKKSLTLDLFRPFQDRGTLPSHRTLLGGNNLLDVNTKLPNSHLSLYLTCSYPPPHLVSRATHALCHPPGLFLSHTSPSPQTASPPFFPSLEMVRATEQLVETRREAGCASAWVAGAPLWEVTVDPLALEVLEEMLSTLWENVSDPRVTLSGL